jgi:S1-C subfamily serine protease
MVNLGDLLNTVMTKTSPASHLLSGLLGGLLAVVAGAILIATDVIDTGDDRTVVRQESVTRPAANPSDGGGLTVSEIYERAGPGVVFIQARGGAAGVLGEGAATGSGFVLDKEGYLLTNAHVLEGASDVTVRFGEDDSIDAEVVGEDPSTDLAVLKVDPKDAKLEPIPLGDSKSAQVGDVAIAVGNPFGFDDTVTTGIVSAVQRQIEAPNGFSIDDVIQTDASINPGNSGGPLLDAQGRVIGINAQIASRGGGGSVGIGFAIPVNTAKEVVPQLKEDGKIDRAFIGVTTADVTEDIARDLNLPTEEGALIQEVVEGGPADKAGLRAGRTETGEGLVAGGDLIVKVDGVDIKEPQDVADAIEDNKPGDEVVIEFFRGDDRRSTTVTLGKRPRENRSAGPGGSPVPPDEESPSPPEGFPFP